MSRTFATHGEAIQWASQIEGQMATGAFVDRSEVAQVRFVDLIDRYLREIAPRKRGGHLERGKLKSYLAHPLFQRPVTAISPRDVAEVRDRRLQQVSAGTVLREFSILRHVLQTARKEWFLPVDNVVGRIRLPSANRPRERRLRPGELERILVAAQAYGGTLSVLIEWQIETGMRREESALLLASDVDRVSGIVQVARSKNGLPRAIPLSERALGIAEELSEQAEGPIFRLRPMSMTRAFGRVCGRIGIDDLTFHDLRHEATSRFVELGFSMPEVMAITGHRDPKMMLRYYQPDARRLALRLRAKGTPRRGD